MKSFAFCTRALAALALSGSITSVMAAPPEIIHMEARSANHTATFSFSSQAAPLSSPPFGGGSWYAANSLVINNVSFANPVIGIYNQFLNLRDVAYIWGDGANYIVVEDGNAAAFNSSAITALVGKTLANFDGGPSVDSLMFNGVSQALTYFGPPIPAVPEPSAALMALAGLGVLGMAARRRRQATAA